MERAENAKKEKKEVEDQRDAVRVVILCMYLRVTHSCTRRHNKSSIT